MRTHNIVRINEGHSSVQQPGMTKPVKPVSLVDVRHDKFNKNVEK